MKIRLISIFMMLLVITLPIAVSGQVVSSQSSISSISNEIERKLTQPPTQADVIGEDIVLSISGYQPDVLRSGLLEDQGAVIYATLSGIESNPTVEIPRILGVDIISQRVTTVPEGSPVQVTRVVYLPNSDGLISSSNMGHLAVFINRIPKEEDVPDEINIELEARVRFDVSSGLGASPKKLVLREELHDEWVAHKSDSQYLDVYISAIEIGNDYAVFNIFDDTLNEIARNVKISVGDKPRVFSRVPKIGGAPAQLFNQFTINLRSVQSSGTTLDILVTHGGKIERHTISEGESIYPGSGIILERADERTKDGKPWIYATFRGPNNQPENKKIAEFPKKLFSQPEQLNLEQITPKKASSGAQCQTSLGSLPIEEVLSNIEDDLEENNEAPKYGTMIKSLQSCIAEPFGSNPGKVTQPQAQAIGALLLQIQKDSVSKAVNNPEFNAITTFVSGVISNFISKYNNEFPNAPISLGTTVLPVDPLNNYKLAAEQYEFIVGNINGETVEYKSPATTNILDYQAQFKKATLYFSKMGDPYLARKEYQKLLEIYESYDASRQQKAENVFPYEKIITNIAYIDALLQEPSGKKTVAQIDMKEGNGELVTILLEGSSLSDYALNRKSSSALLRIYEPNGASSKDYELQKGQSIPIQEKSEIVWHIDKINEDSVTLSPDVNGVSSITISQGDEVEIRLNDPNSKALIGSNKLITQKVGLQDVNLYKEAHIIVSPNIEAAYSGANLNMHIPIDKRALDLPLFSDSIEEEINNTQELIDKLGEVITKVGKVHDTWKKFCFGVFAAIAAWNLLKTAFGAGEGKAKQDASEIFWDKYGDGCRDSNGRPLTFDECVFTHQDEYEAVLVQAKNARDYADKAIESEIVEGISVTEANKPDLRELARLKAIHEADPTNPDALKDYITVLYNNQNRESEIKITQDITKNKQDILLTAEEKQKLERELYLGKKKIFEQLSAKNDPSVTGVNNADYQAMIKELEIAQLSSTGVPSNKVKTEDLIKVSSITDQNFVKFRDAEIEIATKVLMEKDSSLSEQDAKTKAEEDMNYVYFPHNSNPQFFVSNEPDTVAWYISLFTSNPSTSLTSTTGNTYTVVDEEFDNSVPHKPIVTYYEEGPNEGRIHRISVDAYKYAEITYTTGGLIKDIYIFERNQANALITGEESGITGGPINAVALNAQNQGNTNLVNNLKKVESCINTLNRAKTVGREIVNCAGSNYNVHTDAQPRGSGCTEFYGPSQCKLLYNACDPVLCPATRCDLDGAWRVKDDNVIQTGLIGSSVLCLHNFGIPGTDIGSPAGQVVMPVCITGIYAGLQNIQTVLMEYNDCLNRALVEGEAVGVCDLLRSYYICDVLWKEAVAIFNIKDGVLGKILKFVNNADEGNEYTNFDASMDNAIGGLEFFTQDYAKNTFAQFSGGALPEIGGEICKSAIYGKIPGVGTFTEAVLRPESPPQFTAILDKVPYQDIYGAPESEYQVYYRMFAGANEPITYSVYLKFQGLDGQGSIFPIVPNKLLPAGAFDAETKNFRAVDIYNQVCVSYNSPTYGFREECGFGKTSSGFAIEYAANEIAKKSATNKDIQTAEDCAPSGGRFTAPSSSFLDNTGRVIAGGFSSGVLDTGLVRVCSGVPPGNPEDWNPVGECWEEPGQKGRLLGTCWLHMPSAEKIVTEYSVYEQEDLAAFRGTIGNLSDATINNIAEYAKQLGMDPGYVTKDEIEDAIKKINELKGNYRYKEASELYRKLIDSPLLSSSNTLRFRMELGDIYWEWADYLQHGQANLDSYSGNKEKQSQAEKGISDAAGTDTQTSAQQNNQAITSLNTKPNKIRIIYPFKNQNNKIAVGIEYDKSLAGNDVFLGMIFNNGQEEIKRPLQGLIGKLDENNPNAIKITNSDNILQYFEIDLFNDMLQSNSPWKVGLQINLMNPNGLSTLDSDSNTQDSCNIFLSYNNIQKELVPGNNFLFEIGQTNFNCIDNNLEQPIAADVAIFDIMVSDGNVNQQNYWFLDKVIIENKGPGIIPANTPVKIYFSAVKINDFTESYPLQLMISDYQINEFEYDNGLNLGNNLVIDTNNNYKFDISSIPKGIYYIKGEIIIDTDNIIDNPSNNVHINNEKNTPNYKT